MLRTYHDGGCQTNSWCSQGGTCSHSLRETVKDGLKLVLFQILLLELDVKDFVIAYNCNQYVVLWVVVMLEGKLNLQSDL